MKVSLSKEVLNGQGVNTSFTFVGCKHLFENGINSLQSSNVKFLDRLPRLSSSQSFHSIFISEQWLIAHDFPSLKKFLDHYDRYAIFVVANKKSMILAEYANEFLIEDLLRPVECVEPIILKLAELAEKKRNYSIQMIGQSHEISLYRRALDQSASAIEITDANGVIVYVNDQFEESSGYTSAELIGQKPSIVASGRMDSLFFQNLWESISSGKVWKGDFENRRKDGTLFYQRSTIRPVQRPDGLITHYIAIKDDIQSIQENELTKEFIINAASIATWDWHIDKEYIDYNDQWASLIGFTQKELGEKKGFWESRLHPDDKHRVLQLLYDHIELKTEHHEAIYRLKHKDGHYVWIHDSGKVIATDKNGKATRMAGVYVDVTELMTTQEALSIERDQLAQTQQVARTGSCFFDFKQGCFTYFSDVARELIMLPESGNIQFEQVLRKIPLEEVEMVKGYYEKILKGEHIHLFHRVLHAEDFVWLKIEGTPVVDSHGKASGLLAVIQDVTDLKTQIKTISDQNQQLSESHEMAQMGGWTLNLTTNQAQWSKQLLNILGEDLELEEHESERYLAKIHPEEREKAVEVFQEAKKNGTPYTQYYRLLLEHDKIKFAEERGWFIFDDEGRAIEARGITKDITQGVKANRLNEIQEQRLSAAAEIAGLGYWEFDYSIGEVYWSKELFALLQVDPDKESASFDRYVELIHPEDRQESLRQFEESAQFGFFKRQHRMLLDSGDIIYLEESASFEMDKEGNPLIARGVSYNVTEAKLRALKLEEETKMHLRAQSIAHIGHFKFEIKSQEFEWSEEVYKIWGIKNEGQKIAFHDLVKLVASEDLEEIIESIKNSIETKQSGNVIHKIIKDDLSHRMVDVRWQVELDVNGNAEYFVGTVHDITESWEVNDKLREAEKIALLGHWTLDHITGELFWSDQVYEIFDLKPQEFPATYEAFLSYIHPEDRAMVNEVYARSVETKSLYEVDHRLLVNGKVKYVSEKAVTQYDDKGKPIKSIGTVQDITEKKIAQNKADKASKRLGMLVESIPDLIFVFDKEGYYIDYFESAFDQPLVPPEVFMGKHYSEVLPKSVTQKIDKFLPLALGTGEVQKFPFQLDKEGAEKWYEATMAPYRDGDEVIGVTIVNRDVTKEKVYENQLVDTTQNLELILNSLDKLLCIVDENGRYIDVFYSENGIKPIMSKEEIIGKKWKEVMPPHVHDKIAYAFKLVDKKNISTQVSCSLVINDMEQFFEASVSPFKDKRKGVKGYAVLVSNITDREKAKELLKKSEERFKKHSEFLPHILWTRNQKGELTYMNAKGKEYYGKFLNKINKLSKNPLYVIHPQDRPLSLRLWKRADRNKESFQNLERRKDHKGIYRWFNIKVDPIFDNDGEFVSWIGVATDVDQEKRVAQENEKLVNSLQERVKEAQCMYAISNLAEKVNLSLESVLDEAVHIIPTGFQNPELTKAQIVYGGHNYGKRVHYRNKRVHDLKVRDQKVGEIIVGVSAKSASGQLNYFLKEEELLLEAIVDNLNLIVAQKLDQLVVAESEKRFKSLFDSASIGIVIQDLPTLQIVDVNQSMSNLLHFDHEEFLGLTLLDLSPVQQANGVSSIEKFEEVNKSTSGGYFWQLLDNYGQNIYCAININTLDIEGKQYQVSFIRNVSDEMAAYSALENSEELYRNIFENIQEGYYLRDLQGQIININPEGLRILEASDDQVIGHSAREFFMHVDRNEITFNDEDNTVVQDLQVIAVTPLGKEKILSINKKLISSKDAPWIVECSFRDITQSVLLNKLQTLTLKLVNEEHNSSEQILQNAMDEVCKVFGTDHAFFHFVDSKEHEVRYSTISKDSGIKIIPHAVQFDKLGFWRSVIDDRVGKIFNKKEILLAKRSKPDGKIDNAMITPIIIKGQIVAVVGVCNRSYDFTETELGLLTDFGPQFYSLFDQAKTKDAYLISLDNLEKSQKAGKIGAWTYDVVFDHTWWSDIMFELYGIDVADGVPANNWIEFTHPDDRDMHIKAFEQSFASGNFECEYRLVTPKGQIRHLKAMADIKRGANGVPVKFNGFVQDVTAIKEAEMAIIEEKQKFENIVDALPGIVYRLSLPEIRLEYVSEHTLELLGIPPNLFANANGEDFILSLIHPDDWEGVRKVISRAVEDVDTYSLIHRMKKDDGKYVWVSNTGKVSLVDGGNTYNVEGFIYDVTDRIKNEERIMNAVMEASDKEKSRISKEIHDSLQQTLTIASLNLEFVKKEKKQLSPLAQEKLKTGWSYLKRSMDDSRSIAHRLMPKAINDFGVVPVLKDMFEELNRSGEIEFEFISNFEERIKIPAATNVYKVVQEAVNNILKHSKAKTVTVQYLLLNDIIQLSIEDDGHGFDLAKISSEAFGLASMKSRATALSAEMIMDSYPGHGTTIVLEIPFNENIKYYE